MLVSSALLNAGERERERERVYRGASAAEAKGGWASMSREGWVANRGFAKQCRLVL